MVSVAISRANPIIVVIQATSKATSAARGVISSVLSSTATGGRRSGRDGTIFGHLPVPVSDPPHTLRGAATRRLRSRTAM